MRNSQYLAISCFIFLGIASRLIPHPPNLTALGALALFGPLYMEKRWTVAATLFSTLFLSDIFLGSHTTAFFVYVAMGLIMLIGEKLKKMSVYSTPVVCFASSVLFFVVSNFGVWMTTSMYPKTISGLGLCYLSAIPFFSNQILGDVIYSTILLGLYFAKQSFRPEAS